MAIRIIAIYLHSIYVSSWLNLILMSPTIYHCTIILDLYNFL